MKGSLFGYLGISDSGKLELYVSPQRLNVIGARLEKGSKFSHAVYNFIDDSSPELSVPALKSLQNYFDGKDHRSGLIFGEEVKKKRK